MNNFGYWKDRIRVGQLTEAISRMKGNSYSHIITSLQQVNQNFTDIDHFLSTYAAYVLEVKLEYIPTSVRICLLVLYSLSFLLCLTGNALVCYVVYADKTMRRATNIFLVALSCSDCLMMLLCVPFTVSSNLITNQWSFGSLACSFIGYLQVASATERSFILIVISLNRYYAVFSPMKKKLFSKKSCCAAIAFITLTSLVIPLPTAIYSKILPVTNSSDAEDGLCLEDWPAYSGKQWYGIGIMAVTFGLPLLVLCATYSHMACILWGKQSSAEEETLASIDRIRQANKMKFTKLMTVMITSYVICWLPLEVITVIGEFDVTIYSIKYVDLIWILAHWLAISNSFINPIIYFTLIHSYRTSLKLLLAVLTDRPIRGSDVQREMTRRRSSSVGLLYHSRILVPNVTVRTFNQESL